MCKIIYQMLKYSDFIKEREIVENEKVINEFVEFLLPLWKPEPLCEDNKNWNTGKKNRSFYIQVSQNDDGKLDLKSKIEDIKKNLEMTKKSKKENDGQSRIGIYTTYIYFEIKEGNTDKWIKVRITYHPPSRGYGVKTKENKKIDKYVFVDLLSKTESDKIHEKKREDEFKRLYNLKGDGEYIDDDPNGESENPRTKKQKIQERIDIDYPLDDTDIENWCEPNFNKQYNKKIFHKQLVEKDLLPKLKGKTKKYIDLDGEKDPTKIMKEIVNYVKSYCEINENTKITNIHSEILFD